MFSKEVTWKNDFTNETEKETLLFNLTVSDIVQLNVIHAPEGYGEYLKRLVANTRNNKEVYDTFMDLIHRSYGVRVGNEHVRNEKVWEAFYRSAPFDALLEIFFTDGGELMGEMMGGLINEDLLKRAKEREAGIKAPTRPEPQDYKPSARQIAAERVQHGFENAPDKAPEAEKPTYLGTDKQAQFEAWLAEQEKAESSSGYVARPPHEG